MKSIKKFLKKSRTIRQLARFYYRLKKRTGFISPHTTNIAPVYSRECPSNQAMADIFKGSWTSAFPDEYHVKAGETRHFDFAVDWRVDWVNSILPGGINKFSVLELGPFEGYNTWQMEKLGVKSVLSIEANNLNFLKCLVVKEIARLNARFLYGDFIPYFENSTERFDMVWASGILYHSAEPLKLLESISRVSNKLFLYTHYYDEQAIQGNPFLSDFYNREKNITVETGGFKYLLHFRSYNEKKDSFFCGGIEDYSFWMEKKDILSFLNHLGFNEIKTRLDQLDNPHGPVLCLLAEKNR